MPGTLLNSRLWRSFPMPIVFYSCSALEADERLGEWRQYSRPAKTIGVASARRLARDQITEAAKGGLKSLNRLPPGNAWAAWEIGGLGNPPGCR